MSSVLASNSIPHERRLSGVNDRRRLRVLIAGEHAEEIELLARFVAEIEHDVVARETDVEAVCAATVSEHPDVALVGLGVASEHALELIGNIVHEAACPVIALMPKHDVDFIRAAAIRGVFAFIVDTAPDELQSAIDISLRRFAEYHNLQAAFGRRAAIEQAKGILMERHSIGAERAFDMLLDQSREQRSKVVDVAAAIVATQPLLRSVGGHASPVGATFESSDETPVAT